MGTGTLGWSTTSVVGGETNLATETADLESKAYAEYQLDGGLSGEQSRGVLGLTIQCAQCHHHPYEKWSQDDYWGLAAFFARVQLVNPNAKAPAKAPAKGRAR